MTEHEIFLRLQELSESDGEGLDKLAEEVGAFCREPAKTVLAEWIGGTDAHPIPSAFVCANLQEFALAEMLRCADSIDPALRVQLMEMVATQQIVFWELIVTALEPLLRDLTPAVTSGVVEGWRTCDAAYLLVRKLVRLKESDASGFATEDQFTRQAENERDREIDQWMGSETWKAVFIDPA